MREQITDKELLDLIIWDDAEDFEIVSSTIVDQTRWHVSIELVFRRLSDKKLFILTWQKAATEYQDNRPPEEAFEAEAYQEIVIRYRKAEQC